MQNLTRISIPLTINEREALRILARQELRDPREHVRYLLQRELTHRGILPTNSNTNAEAAKQTGVGVVPVNP